MSPAATRVCQFYYLPALLLLLLSGCDGGGGDSANGSNPSLTGWQRQSANPLIVPALTSTQQDYGPADPSVLFDAEDNKWKSWFSSTLEDRTSGIKTITIGEPV